MFDPFKQKQLMNGFEKLKSVPVPSSNIDSIEEMKKLAGIHKINDMGMNMSLTGTEKAEIQREKNIQPGTSEWFQLWFSLPYMTGEKPYDK